VQHFAAQTSNITFHGAFRSPQDLQRIYRDLDLVWAVYDRADANVRAAIPNKLFEAAWFGVPILVAKETALAQTVANWGGGFQVDSASVESIGTILDRLTPALVHEARQSLYSLRPNQLLEDDRHLADFLRRVQGRTPPGAPPHL